MREKYFKEVITMHVIMIALGIVLIVMGIKGIFDKSKK
jgi:hypothetical protein